MKIRIITDSTTEITQAEAKQLGITVIPLKTSFGDEEYLDGIDLTPEEFYAKLASNKNLPKTSQLNPFDFEQVFRKAQEAGEAVIVLCLAASLSGTYQSALVAKENCGGDIWVIDSGTTTAAMQILVRHAISLRDGGMEAAELAHRLEEDKKSVLLFAAIDTLEYLYKGGRLSRTSAFAGTILQIKPILTLDRSALKVIGKCRGAENAHKKVLQLTQEAGGIDFDRPFAIGYAGSRERFEPFAQQCESYFEGRQPIICKIGSVIGTHAGPGAVAIAFFKQG